MKSNIFKQCLSIYSITLQKSEEIKNNLMVHINLTGILRVSAIRVSLSAHPFFSEQAHGGLYVFSLRGRTHVFLVHMDYLPSFSLYTPVFLRPHDALFGCSRIRINLHMLRWIGVKLELNFTLIHFNTCGLR
jgi:hypothetical protein